jgi:hypothetical protein
MEPKLKAIELIDKFEDFVDYQEDDCFTQREKILINAKRCALIAVDEIQDFMIDSDDFNIYWVNYWREVKQEIEIL